MDRKLLIALPALAVMTLAGCGSAPPASEKKAEVKKAAPAEPISGQSALFSMYQAARQWSGDIQVLRLESIPIESVKPSAGKNGAWRAVFISPSKQQKAEYTYSVVEESATLHKGTFAQGTQAYIRSPQVRPFEIQAVKIDSTVAQENADKTKDIVEYRKKKTGDIPNQYILEWTSQTLTPAWRVIYGQSISNSDMSIYIDCQTGTFLKKAR